MGNASSGGTAAQNDSNLDEEIGSSLALNKLDSFKSLVSDAFMSGESIDKKVAQSYLCLSVVHDNVEALQWLINSMECDPRVTDESSKSLVHFAAKEGSLSSIMYLVETVQLGIDDLDMDGYTPFLCAVSGGHLPCVKYLASKLPSKSVSMQSLKDGRNCIHLCAQEGHIAVLRWLVNAYPSIQTDRIEKTEGLTPFHLAARSGHATVLDFLLRHCNADSDAVDSNGRVALHHASKNDQIDAIRYLVEQLCMDPSTEDYFGQSSVEIARLNSSSKALQFFSEMEKSRDFI